MIGCVRCWLGLHRWSLGTKEINRRPITNDEKYWGVECKWNEFLDIDDIIVTFEEKCIRCGCRRET